MEDKRVAKFFIETLLEETIEEVEVQPQEFTYSDFDKASYEEKTIGIAIFRLDFVATIKTGDNQYKKVLIEIQKAKNEIDLMRFRNYLAEQYKKEDEVRGGDGKKKTALPIITIYLLGFNLAGIESPAVKVNRCYIDLLTHKVIESKSDFIEKLTHDCYVVQLPRIHVKVQTKLEKLLSVFEQNYFVDDKGIIKEYNHAIDNDVMKTIVDILHYAGTDPKSKKKIEDEQEAWRVFDVFTLDARNQLKEAYEEMRKVRDTLEEKEKALEETNKKIEEQDKLIEALKQQIGKK